MIPLREVDECLGSEFDGVEKNQTKYILKYSSSESVQRKKAAAIPKFAKAIVCKNNASQRVVKNTLPSWLLISF